MSTIEQRADDLIADVTSDENLCALREYAERGMALDDAIEEVSGEISWDNWKDEEGNSMDVSGVLFSRLEWLREKLGEKDGDDGEHHDTIDMVQRILEAI